MPPKNRAYFPKGRFAPKVRIPGAARSLGKSFFVPSRGGIRDDKNGRFLPPQPLIFYFCPLLN
jgi:hypothetical protein